MHSASSEASTLPPESTAQVSPSAAGFTRPCSSAATPTAPAPSTTSFDRSSSSTIAWATSSSVTVTISSTCCSSSGLVTAPGFFTAIPSQIVFVSDSQRTPTTRASGTARAMPEISPPPPSGTTISRTSGAWRAISRPTVPWPATTAGWSKAGTTVAPLLGGQPLGLRDGVLEAALHQPHLAAVLRAPPRPSPPARPRASRARPAIPPGARRSATAWAWFPALPATTRAPSGRAAIALRAPRTLKDPVSWRFSALSST